MHTERQQMYRGHSVVADQSGNGPETQRGVVEELHCDERGEPGGRGLGEELVVVGGDVEGADLVREVCLEGGREEGNGVDHCFAISYISILYSTVAALTEDGWDVDDEEDEVDQVALPAPD